VKATLHDVSHWVHDCEPATTPHRYVGIVKHHGVEVGRTPHDYPSMGHALEAAQTLLKACYERHNAGKEPYTAPE
jgi:hypothetical protein